MDVAQRYSIAYKGLKDGMHDFSFEIDGSLFEAYDNEEIKAAECRAEVALNRSETQLDLQIRIEGYVVVACDRCLDDCQIPIDYENRLLVKFSDEVHGEDFDGEVLWLLSGEDELDLSQYLYESIILSLPYQRVHPEGECNPEMMKRFRIVTGAEFADIEHAEEEKGEVKGEWSKLEALKKELEEESGKK